MQSERTLSSFLDDEFLQIQSADELSRLLRLSEESEGKVDWTEDISSRRVSESWPWDNCDIKASLDIYT